MSESQSRYSIVERLTERKLGLITDKSNLGLEITEAEQEVENTTKDLADWENDVKKDIEKTRRIKKRHIENAKTSLKNAKTQKDEQAKTCDKKLDTIDTALTKLEEISKSASEY